MELVVFILRLLQEPQLLLQLALFQLILQLLLDLEVHLLLLAPQLQEQLLKLSSKSLLLEQLHFQAHGILLLTQAKP
jgi:hypothetical protein